MIIGNNRKQLDAWLADETTVLLLLCGAENGSKAREVRDFIQRTRADNSRHYDFFQHEVLVTDDGKVTAPEKQQWFENASDCYAILRNRTPNKPKVVVKRGPITDILFTDGNQDPDYVQIRIAFLTQ